MSAPNPLTQPNQPATPPTGTHSQVTTDQISQQSKSPSRETAQPPRTSPQEVVTKSCETPVEPIKNNHQVKTTVRPPSSIKKKSQWGNVKSQPKPAPQSHNFPGSCIASEVEVKPESDWTLVERRHSPQKQETPSPSPEPETKCGGSRPKQSVRKPEFMNCDKSGGRPAKCSEEMIVDNLTIEHIANHCSVCFTSHGINCQIETKL